jgi:hypothetical protein
MSIGIVFAYLCKFGQKLQDHLASGLLLCSPNISLHRCRCMHSCLPYKCNVILDLGSPNIARIRRSRVRLLPFLRRLSRRENAEKAPSFTEKEGREPSPAKPEGECARLAVERRGWQSKRSRRRKSSLPGAHYQVVYMAQQVIQLDGGLKRYRMRRVDIITASFGVRSRFNYCCNSYRFISNFYHFAGGGCVRL